MDEDFDNQGNALILSLLFLIYFASKKKKDLLETLKFSYELKKKGEKKSSFNAMSFYLARPASSLLLILPIWWDSQIIFSFFLFKPLMMMKRFLKWTVNP